ncbi:MAG: DUF3604 domain-containing protein [Gammaproteobacteria bacterium]|nr:DUF3604 domain-containing protein [Gammaproteobacteria bacterium]
MLNIHTDEDIPMVRFVVFLLIPLLSSCDGTEAPSTTTPTAEATAATPLIDTGCQDQSPNGIALFGDVHVHTKFSFDAAANSFGATPIDANAFARGEAIKFFPLSEAGEPVGAAQIDRPLDFLAVTDHGEFLGERSLCRTEGSPAYDTKFCTNTRIDERTGMRMFGSVITTQTPSRISDVCLDDGSRCLDYAKPPWQAMQAAANSANTPCEFTSFVAYEYTGTPGTSNYHRNVIFRDENVPELPVSYVEAPIDTALWAGLDDVCLKSEGCDYLTIPHNTNLANGRMAPYKGLEDTIDAKRSYAETRLRREPIMEIFQHKGGSECINGLTTVLGAPDELCNVEAVRTFGEEKTVPTQRVVDGALVTGTTTMVTNECQPGVNGSYGMIGAGCVDATDFQRSALLVGLKETRQIGLNPIKLGIIAATDTHSANPGGVLESNWQGAVSGESSPAKRLEPGLLTSGIDGNPGGLAGVWATENTRDAIFEAMLRREVFGTSGPRIKVRLFAGWSFADNLCEQADMIDIAYRDGVPMGSDLPATAGSEQPTLLAWATQDPLGQSLKSLQLIKGWVDTDGQMRNEVITVAEADDGRGSFCRTFTDEDFDPTKPTYYYLRAVERQTPRWHTYDCEKIAADARPAVCTNGHYPEMTTEMAWSSPIWYQSSGDN